jgi:hypothetical protein
LPLNVAVDVGSPVESLEIVHLSAAAASPFWNISLETANEFYTWGWRASMFGALITFFGVAFLYWGTRVRDHDFEHNIATLNVEAGGARERAGKLEERAAGLEKEAEQAREGNCYSKRRDRSRQ